MGAEGSKESEEKVRIAEEEWRKQRRKLEEMEWKEKYEKLRIEREMREQMERLEKKSEELAKLRALEIRTKWQEEEVTKLKKREEELLREMERLRVLEAKEKGQFQQTTWQQQNYHDNNAAAVLQQAQITQQQQFVVEPSAPPVVPPLIANAPKTRQRSSSRSRATVQLTINQRLAASNVNFVEWTDVDYIHQFFNLSRSTAENLVKLFKENKTIPFIAHYRHDVTVGMNIDDLKNIKTAYDTVLVIKQKANDFTREFDKQGKWSPEIHVYLHSVKFLEDFKHVKLAYKGLLHNLAEKCQRRGLGIVADAVITGAYIQPLSYFVNSNAKELQNEKFVRDGIVCILADKINKDVCTIAEIKRLRDLHPLNIVTSKIEGDDKNKEPSNSQQKSSIMNYKSYEKFSACVKLLTPHQIMEINQGQAKKIFNVRVEISPHCAREFKEYCKKQYGSFSQVSPLHEQLLTAAYNHLWEKFLKGFIATQTRDELTKKAENALVDELAKDIKHLLLTPTVKNKVVIGIEPGIQDGCKVVVLSKDQIVKTEKIFPFDKNNPRARQTAVRTLGDMILEHKCSILAVGNGPTRYDTMLFLKEFIEKVNSIQKKIGYLFIDVFDIEACKVNASREYPNVDETFLGALCIAKRMMNPMGEWVKIETQKLCRYKQQYKNLPENNLIQRVNEAITEAVSSVGVDLNTASLSLLQRVAGLDEAKAKSIIERRESSGPFITRSDLLKVPGISTKVYQQCAGFVRVFPGSVVSKHPQIVEDSFNYLDQTSIHPEFYPLAEAFIKTLNCSQKDIGTKRFIFAVRIAADQLNELSTSLNCNIEILKTIVNALSMEKGEDVRGTMNTSMFHTNVKTWENLSQGAVVNGIVRFVTSVGAFVDICAEVDGFLHKSNTLSTMKGQNLHMGQCIQVKINSFNKERRRIELALIKCF